MLLEKPIGHDLASARAINDQVGSVFQECQVFRIDHYLGKETVQNLSALRFATALQKSSWLRSFSPMRHARGIKCEAPGAICTSQPGAALCNHHRLRYAGADSSRSDSTHR